MFNTQWGALKEKSWNLGLKPITGSMKQVVQGDGQKIWKDIKFRKNFYFYHNCPMQR